jgi:NADH-quinone oxidoreductase subunit N
MNIPFPNLIPVIPEIIITTFASILLLVELFVKRKAVLGYIAIIAAAAAFYALFCTDCLGVTFSDMFINDDYSRYFKVIFLINVVLTVLISLRYIQKEDAEYGEYYSLILFATAGMMLMASAKDFIILYLGLELMALSTYILAGIKKHDIKSNEAAIKYMLLGAFSSSLLLFGISLLYGITASTNIYDIGKFIISAKFTPVLMVSMILITVGFAFKIAAAPFHMWTPDVYEGAPTSVTAFMSVGPKAAGFAVMGRVFYYAFNGLQLEWTPILIGLCILTMAVGNIVALSQTNIKRMLAYSSIAHAGYAMLGVIAGTVEGQNAMITYLIIYAFMNIGAFGIVILLNKGEQISDYCGLSKSHPLIAAVMLVFMFSLTGIPPTAGFIGKFNIFAAAINAGFTWVVVIAVIFSAISAFYYLRVVMNMYMKTSEEDSLITTSPSLGIALFLSVLAVLVIGILPSFVII